MTDVERIVEALAAYTDGRTAGPNALRKAFRSGLLLGVELGASKAGDAYEALLQMESVRLGMEDASYLIARNDRAALKPFLGES